MLRGIYSSAAAMLTHMEQTASTANNLANVNTMGFKKDLLVFNSQPEVDIWRTDDPTHLDIYGRQIPKYMGQLSTGNTDTQVFRDQSEGHAVATGNPLDVFLDGPGFLRFDTPEGERYSRNGNLTQDRDNFLVDQLGNRVVGTGGPIVLPPNGASISKEGLVLDRDQNVIGQLSLAHFEDVQLLRKDGDNLWHNEGSPETEGETSVLSGLLEGSNVDVSRGIVDLISQSRHFEMAGKSLKTGDEVLNLIVNQLGRMPR